MRSPLGKAVRRRFDDQLKRRLPAFERTRVNNTQGWPVYRRQIRPGFFAFLMLCLDRQRDHFTVECAWSPHGDYPLGARPSSPRDWPEREIVRDSPAPEFRFRLPELWQSYDLWWQLVPQEQTDQRFDAFLNAVVANEHARALKLTEEPPLEDAMSRVQPLVD